MAEKCMQYSPHTVQHYVPLPAEAGGVKLRPSSSRTGCLCFEDAPMCPGMRISCRSLIPDASSPSRCAQGPPPAPGATLQPSPATPRRHSPIYLQSNWRVTVHLPPLLTIVTWDTLPTQRHWSISPFLGVILIRIQVSPQRNASSSQAKTPACCWCTSWTTKSAGVTTALRGTAPTAIPLNCCQMLQH